MRQLAARGLGREQPTLFLTNNFQARPREAVTSYARRNDIEDGLDTNVNFFHRDCLSSEVRWNVNLDLTLTVIANGCYLGLCISSVGSHGTSSLTVFLRRPTNKHRVASKPPEPSAQPTVSLRLANTPDSSHA